MAVLINHNQNTERGFAIIDAIMGAAIAALVATAFLLAVTQSLKANEATKEKLVAELYLMEALEVGYELARTDWAALDPATCTDTSPCQLVAGASDWSLSAGEETLAGGFVRSIEIKDVERDQLTFPNTIVGSGTTDPATVEYVATVTWHVNGEDLSESASTLLYDM